MWTALVNRGKKLVALTGKAVKGVLRGVKEWSRPARVAAHAIADMRKTKTELIAENALLRQQLIVVKRQSKRARLTRSERIAATFFARLTRWWRGTILTVQPDTILRWHRELFRLAWWLKSRPTGSKPKNKTVTETIRLIRQMAMENRFYVKLADMWNWQDAVAWR
jgi:putative transposase